MNPIPYWHRLAQAAMVTGPVLLIVANLAGVNRTGTDRQTLSWVAEHQSTYLFSTVIFLTGLGLLVPAGWLLATSLRRHTRLGAVGGTCYFIGLFASLVTNATYLFNARLITLPGGVSAAAVDIKERADEDGGVGLFVLLSPLLAIGIVILAVGLALERAVPPAGAAALVLGAIAVETAEIAGAPTAVLTLALLVLLAGWAVAAVYSNRWERVSQPTVAAVEAVAQ